MNDKTQKFNELQKLKTQSDYIAFIFTYLGSLRPVASKIK